MTTALPEPQADIRPIPAERYIREAASDSEDAVTIVALGPLTNVALAIQQEPSLEDRVREIFVMGGAVEVPGNITPHAEFNIYDDPRAANVVFESGIPVTLVGLDVCEQVAFGRDDDDWKSGATAGERLAARILEGWFDIHPEYDRYVLCDPLTVAAVVEPNLIELRTASVHVIEDGERKGKTIAQYGPGNIRVAAAVNIPRAHDFTLNRLAPIPSP